MKVGSGGIAAMQKAIDFLKGMLDYEKSLGKTSMRKLLLKGGDLQVLQFNTEDMKKVEKMLDEFANVALPDDFCSLLSLQGILRGKSLSGRIPLQTECCTGHIHRSRKRK